MRRSLFQFLLFFILLKIGFGWQALGQSEPLERDNQSETQPLFPLALFLNNSACFSLSSVLEELELTPALKPIPFLPLPILLKSEVDSQIDSAHLSRTDLSEPILSITDNQKRDGDFGAQLWIVEDRTFYKQWKSGLAQNLMTTRRVNRNDPIFTTVFFTGQKADSKGFFSVTYDLEIKRPDGTTYGSQKNVVGLSGLIAKNFSARDWQLGRDYLSINIDPDDLTGIYKIEAKVTDNVGKKTVLLYVSFLVSD